MDLDLLFRLGNLYVMPFWLLMIFAPGWSKTAALVRSPWICIGPVLLYGWVIAPQVPGLFADIAQPELANITAIFEAREAVFVGWMHFLAFDLFVGRWVYHDARSRGVTPFVTAPVLFATLMLGPLGFGVWLLLRTRFPAPAEAT